MNLFNKLTATVFTIGVVLVMALLLLTWPVILLAQLLGFNVDPANRQLHKLRRWFPLRVAKTIPTTDIRELQEYWSGNKEQHPKAGESGIVEIYALVVSVLPDGSYQRSENGASDQFQTHTLRVYPEQRWAYNQEFVTPRQLRGIRIDLERRNYRVLNVYYRLGNSDVRCFDRKHI